VSSQRNKKWWWQALLVWALFGSIAVWKGSVDGEPTGESVIAAVAVGPFLAICFLAVYGWERFRGR
jgi:hypothetical protein